MLSQRIWPDPKEISGMPRRGAGDGRVGSDELQSGINDPSRATTFRISHLTARLPREDTSVVRLPTPVSSRGRAQRPSRRSHDGRRSSRVTLQRRMRVPRRRCHARRLRVVGVARLLAHGRVALPVGIELVRLGSERAGTADSHRALPVLLQRRARLTASEGGVERTVRAARRCASTLLEPARRREAWSLAIANPRDLGAVHLGCRDTNHRAATVDDRPPLFVSD